MNAIARVLEQWYRRNHPLHPVVFERELTPNVSTIVEAAPETLVSRWHYPMVAVAWPQSTHYGSLSIATCVIESITIGDQEQIAGDVLVGRENAGVDMPVAFRAFSSDSPPRLRVRSLAPTHFVWALLCSVYEEGACPP